MFPRFASVCICFVLTAFQSRADVRANGDNAIAEETPNRKLGTCLVRATETLTLSSEVAGVVASTAVTVDASVDVGNPLLSLDDRDANLARRQADVELLRAQAAAERAKAVIVQVKSTVNFRKDDLQRHEQLDSNVLDSELRRLKESLEHAQAEHVIAYQEYLQAVQLVETAKLRIEMSELTLGRLDIVAPTAGQVVKLLTSPGERVEIGEPLVELRIMDRMQCEIEIDEKLQSVEELEQRGIIAFALVAGAEHQLEGRIVSVGNEVNARGMLTARIELQNQRLGERWLLSHGTSVNLFWKD